MEIKTAEFVTSLADYGPFEGMGLPQIAVVGKSTVGKSTMINRLCRRNQLARPSSTPGKTRLINIFLLNGSFHLVDLPGYGFAKVDKKEKQRWGTMMQDYFTQSEALKHVLCLVDIRHEPSANDCLMYEWIRSQGLRTIVVATKLDKIKRSQTAKQKKLIRETLGLEDTEPVIPFSAETKQGREEIYEVIEGIMKGEDTECAISE